MISGIDLAASVDYTLKNDKDNPTVFKIGVLPAYILAQLGAQAQQMDNKAQIDTMFKVLQVAIKGWTNLDKVEFKTAKENMFGREMDVVPLAVIEQLPLDAIVELSTKVFEINKLSEAEIKN